MVLLLLLVELVLTLLPSKYRDDPLSRAFTIFKFASVCAPETRLFNVLPSLLVEVLSDVDDEIVLFDDVPLPRMFDVKYNEFPSD